MHYEYLFWFMAATVATALVGGSLCGHLRSIKHLLMGVFALAAIVFVVALQLSQRGGFSDQSAMLSIAAFMFSLVIGAAASLLTRRLRQRR